MYSETKSYVSLAIGCMFAKGYLEPNDHIVDYFPEKLPHGGPKSELAQLTIRDMLRMTTPYSMTTYKHRPTKDWVGSFFTARADHAPGSYFVMTQAAAIRFVLLWKMYGDAVTGNVAE